jgi:hypothetical protein
MQSELQRISASSTPKYANNARISRLFTCKRDHRERTARHRMRCCPGFSPEGTCAVRFRQGPRRMQCDYKSGSRLMESCEHLESALRTRRFHTYLETAIRHSAGKAGCCDRYLVHPFCAGARHRGRPRTIPGQFAYADSGGTPAVCCKSRTRPK